MKAEIIKSVIEELNGDANGYIGFDVGDIETNDPVLTFTDWALAEYKDKTSALAMNDSDAYTTVGLALKIDGRVIEITDSKQDNGVDYREVYYCDEENGQGNIDTDPIEVTY
mgnify:CR=1 FL=1